MRQQQQEVIEWSRYKTLASNLANMSPQHGLQISSCPDSLRLLLIPSNPSPSSPVSSTVFSFPSIRTKWQSKSIAPPWSLAGSHSHPLSLSSPGGLSSLSDSTSPSTGSGFCPQLIWSGFYCDLAGLLVGASGGHDPSPCSRQEPGILRVWTACFRGGP